MSFAVQATHVSRTGPLPAALGAIAALLLAPGAARAERPRVDRLKVDKSDHVMKAYDGRELVATYEIAIGQGGLGQKNYEGDMTTPIGRYRIDGRHKSDSYHLFLHISYPNRADRRRYREGVERGEFPEGVGAGSAIGIHGQPEGAEDWPHKETDWTAGCIAVDNDEIEELYRTVTHGAVIVITR